MYGMDGHPYLYNPPRLRHQPTPFPTLVLLMAIGTLDHTNAHMLATT